MLKLKAYALKKDGTPAAAFGRLCVETNVPYGLNGDVSAAAFGRLCVETFAEETTTPTGIAAAFGRLCVETTKTKETQDLQNGSRLRAAVC